MWVPSAVLSEELVVMEGQYLAPQFGLSYVPTIITNCTELVSEACLWSEQQQIFRHNLEGAVWSLQAHCRQRWMVHLATCKLCALLYVALAMIPTRRFWACL